MHFVEKFGVSSEKWRLHCNLPAQMNHTYQKHIVNVKTMILLNSQIYYATIR